jgi:hypothetical protein
MHQRVDPMCSNAVSAYPISRASFGAGSLLDGHCFTKQKVYRPDENIFEMLNQTMVKNGV